MISVDAQLQKAVDILGHIPRAAEQGLARALNASVRAGRESAIESILNRYAVRASDIREKITLTTATADRLAVSIESRSGSLGLDYFPHTPKTWGTGGRGRPLLRAEVIRGQEREVPGAFVAPINGKPMIMMRVGGRTSGGKAKIKRVTTVPMASMLGVESVRRAVEERALAVLDDNLGKEIDRALEKHS